LRAPSPWFDRKRHEDRRGFLLARNHIVTAIRQWFSEEGFLEVDVPALCVSPGNEAHLHAFETEIVRPDGSRDTLYLHTSPEFACKKLLAAGETRIFSLGHVFRNRERTPSHSPEFTMLEWYRAGEPYDRTMADCTSLLRLAADTSGRRVWQWRGRECDVLAEPRRITVNEAFLEFAGVDLLAAVEGDGTPVREKLAAASPVGIADDDSWSDIFSRILVEKVEPQLGVGQVTILDEYPSCEAALARTCSHDRRVSERFEIYACGVELANGFGELTDPEEQRRRFEEEMAIKQRLYGERYPLDEELLAALAFMPPAAGVAVGLDRVVMLATGARRIAQVQWAPVP
jgi:elongation factor P--(R)-beta-lysine ligase